MGDRTNIKNLPETDNSNSPSTNYLPLDLHKPQFSNNISDIQQPENHRLSSRDIAINPNDFTNDSQIKANYIPPVKNIKDYVRDYRENEFLSSRSHKSKNKITSHKSFIQDFILLTSMCFIFQMSIINSTLHQYCNSLGIHEIDGQLNKKGMFFKSSIFSFIYLLVQSSHHFLFKCFQYF